MLPANLWSKLNPSMLTYFDGTDWWVTYSPIVGKTWERLIETYMMHGANFVFNMEPDARATLFGIEDRAIAYMFPQYFRHMMYCVRDCEHKIECDCWKHFKDLKCTKLREGTKVVYVTRDTTAHAARDLLVTSESQLFKQVTPILFVQDITMGDLEWLPILKDKCL